MLEWSFTCSPLDSRISTNLLKNTPGRLEAPDTLKDWITSFLKVTQTADCENKVPKRNNIKKVSNMYTGIIYMRSMSSSWWSFEECEIFSYTARTFRLTCYGPEIVHKVKKNLDLRQKREEVWPCGFRSSPGNNFFHPKHLRV